MTVRAWLCGGVVASFLTAGVGIVRADDDLDAVRKKQTETTLQIGKITSQLHDLRDKLGKADDIAEERKTKDDTRHTLEEKVSADAKVQAARKAVDEARDNVKKLHESEVTNNPDVVAANKEEVAAIETGDELESQLRLAKAALDEANKKLARNPELQKLRSAAEQANTDLRTAPHHSEGVYQAQKALDEARKSLEEKTRALPENKMVADAQKALDDAMKNSKEVVAAKQAKEAADKAYQDEVKNRTTADSDIGAQTKKVEELDAKIKEQHAKEKAAKDKLEEVKSKAAKGNTKLTEANKAVTDAMTAEHKVSEEVRADKCAAADTADKAFTAKLDAKVAADPKGTELKKQLDDLKAQEKDLGDQARKLMTKGATTRPAAATKPAAVGDQLEQRQKAIADNAQRIADARATNDQRIADARKKNEEIRLAHEVKKAGGATTKEAPKAQD